MYKYKRLVIKLGTSTLTAGTSYISQDILFDLASQINTLCKNNCEVVVVSSGAMASGREALSFPKLPKDIPAKQMLSAIGQPRLMAMYTKLFAQYNQIVSQVLLTRQDITERRSYLNSRNTILALLKQKVIPIINENDTVATEEIKVGDNDNLSALVSNLIDADLLLILTDQPGLYTSDPNIDPNATLVKEITEPNIPDELWQSAGKPSDDLGTGGMITKLQAADLARRSGTTVIIAKGNTKNNIIRAAQNESVGTLFRPTHSTLEGRKRFILSDRDTKNIIQIDNGAITALKNGSSLLPVGIISIRGSFERGDTVKLTDQHNVEIALGLTNYSTTELNKISGKQSVDIESLLGYNYGEEVIHRDQLVMI